MTSSTKDTADHTAEPSAEHTIDIHTTAGKLADLRKRVEETLHPVGEKAVEKVHAKGKLTARERILALLDEDSFVELDALARHRSVNFGLQENRPLGDGVVTGYGTIDGRDVCIFSQDAIRPREPRPPTVTCRSRRRWRTRSGSAFRAPSAGGAGCSPRASRRRVPVPRRCTRTARR